MIGGDGGVPENCRTESPRSRDVGGGHEAACWYPVTAGESLHAAAHAWVGPSGGPRAAPPSVQCPNPGELTRPIRVFDAPDLGRSR